ncbi:unnamed protein product, partial [Symbiodinium sp. CCMP2456]
DQMRQAVDHQFVKAATHQQVNRMRHPKQARLTAAAVAAACQEQVCMLSLNETFLAYLPMMHATQADYEMFEMAGMAKWPWRSIRGRIEQRVLVKIHEAKGRLSSRASCCGHPKPYVNSNDNKPAKGLKKFQCRVTLSGKDVVVSMDNKNMLVINGASAPAAGAFLMLGELTAGNEKLISECQQVKMGSGIVNETVAYFGLYAGRAFLLMP